METTTDKRFVIRKLDTSTWSIFDHLKNIYVRNDDNKIARWNKFETCRAICDRLNTQ